MEPLTIVGLLLLIAILVTVVLLFTKGSRQEQPEVPDEAREALLRPEGRPAAGPRRRAGAHRRLQRAEDSDDNEEEHPDLNLPEGKIGAKKMKKLEDKAEKRRQREAMLEEREEKKRRDEELAKKRKKEEERQEAEEKALEEEKRKEKEEQEKKEYEEYLKIKETFSIEEEGEQDLEESLQNESVLQRFIDHIKTSKVIMLEDLAAHFKLKTQEVVDRVITLQEQGELTGVLDDRGKFIFITEEEYESVARFIKQRGRVSIAELAENSNRLININDLEKEVTA